MRVALAKIELFFPYCHSLKEKRHFLRKIKDKVFAKFKIQAHEVMYQDKWQRAQIGFAVVGNDATKVQSIADKIMNLVIEMGVGDIVDSTIEIVSF